MYKIAICGSDIRECSYIEDAILAYRKEKQIPMEMDVFYNPFKHYGR